MVAAQLSNPRRQKSAKHNVSQSTECMPLQRHFDSVGVTLRRQNPRKPRLAAVEQKNVKKDLTNL